jgi:beta-glucanase (GH16 family)
MKRSRRAAAAAAAPAIGTTPLPLLLLLAALLAVCRAGWVDPDSPEDVQRRVSTYDGREYKLVMSDEFNVDGRQFKDGWDPMWTAETHQDDAMTSTGLGALQYYNWSNAKAENGYLNITTTDEKTTWRGYNPYKRKYETLKKEFKSAMVSSWNKFCFTGGIIEVSVKLPGDAHTGGLWPAFWLLGNLGRSTYEASTNLIWPWSYDQCNRDLQVAQEVSACNAVRHFGFNRFQGRGSTEIDVFEAMPGPWPEDTPSWDPIGKPYMSHTLQVAPGIPDHRPKNGEQIDKQHQKWYKGMSYGVNVTSNYHFYGMVIDKTSPQEPVYRSAKQSYKADGISALTSLADTYFNEFHTYSLEWQPGPEGFLRWYRDGQTIFTIEAPTLDLTGAQIPEEPSYIIFNTAVSSSWGFPDPCPPGCDCSCYDCSDPECACAFYDGFCNMLPSSYLVDYVRVWQANDTHQTTGCNPPNFPTRRYIASHSSRYTALGNKDPIKKVVSGGGFCEDDKGCGGHGDCVSSWYRWWDTCSCDEGYTGPTCLVPAYHDDVVYDIDVDFMPPYRLVVPNLLSVLGCVLALAIALSTCIVGHDNAKARRAYDSELKKARLPRG